MVKKEKKARRLLRRILEEMARQIMKLGKRYIRHTVNSVCA